MDLITVYAIVAGGIFATLFLMRVASSLISLTSIIYVTASKHLTYPYLLNRHRILGPWTRANFLLYLVYGAVNVFCIAFRATSATGVGRRAGTLSLINVAFLFPTLHLGLLADILRISLSACRHIHRAVGWTATALLSLHIVIAIVVRQEKFALHDPGNLSALIV